ncbi:MAG TPA: hypothetical protein VGW10_02180 [Solirubrobacteraceae bacterium]|nr:hypothetical protein [Solirubrobacteraceae bacterium]
MLRRALPAGATIVGVAAVLRAVFDPWYLNYDARYALLWSRDAWTGHVPEYEADFAPTPKPLQALVSSIGLPFGDLADDVMTWIVLLSLGVLAWLVFLLGRQLFDNPWVGAVAALVVVTRPVILRDTLLAYQDIPFAALIVGAVLLEARSPRRGVPVLAVLAVAGLLRPEAWVLAGLYWLYLWPASDPRRRVVLALLVAAAPVLWALTDLIVTGDPLHSLHGTAELAEENERRRSITQVPRWGAQYLGYTLREPLILGVPAGLAFAWLYRRDRRSFLPLAVAAAMLAVFAIGPIFGLPLIGRYVRTPAVLLALFYGLAVFGWMLLPRGSRERRVWMAVGALAALASIVFVPVKQANMLRGLDRRFEQDGRLYADLREAGKAPVVRAAFDACGRLSTAEHRPIPYIRYWLDGDPGSVGTIRNRTSPLSSLLLVPRDVRNVRRFYRENFPRRAARRPPGWSTLYANRSWKIYAAPGGCA